MFSAHFEFTFVSEQQNDEFLVLTEGKEMIVC